jgi:predicted Zn-dependent protease
MQGKILKDLLILTGVFALIFFSLKFLNFTDEETTPLISENQEEQIGKAIFKLVENEFDIIEDDTLYQDFIDCISKEFDEVEYDNKSKNPLSFYIVENDDPNAFAVPGGYIFVHTGLIKLAKNQEEITGVVAHELGHVVKNHSTERLIRTFGIAVILGGDQVMAGDILNSAINNKFNREQEEEADQFAFETMLKMNISPRHLGALFARLKEQGPELPEGFNWLSTHPDLSDRIQYFASEPLDSNLQFASPSCNWDLVKTHTETDY